jgi:arylsulfatase A-like enzyme
VKYFLPLLCLALTAYAAPPNVVMIISDDQHWGDYGFMGHAHIQTPHLDQLARQSLTFRHGYVPSSLCSPSLASIITGRYPHEHRITSNDPTKAVPTMPQAEFFKTPDFIKGRQQMVRHLEAWPTLPGLLGKSGYASLQTGKWWLGDYTHGGFTAGMSQGGRHGDLGLDIGRKTMQPIYDFIAGARKESKPFLVWYAPLMPHDPHTPPERLLAKYRPHAPSERVAKYWAMVEWFDETCGELLGYLDREDLTKNTIVVFLSDNGWITDPTTGRFAPRSKLSPYDGGLRTPIMVRWPGHVTPQFSNAPVSSLDLLPTILKACEVPLPDNLPGVDLANPGAVAARPALTGECFTHNFVDQANPASSLRWRWILENGWKLIVPAPQNETGGPELYRLSDDPDEKHDLAAAEPNRVAALRSKLDAWWPGKVATTPPSSLPN